MQIQFTDSPIQAVACDLLAVAVGTDVESDLAALDKHFGGKLIPWAKARSFDGSPGSTLATPGLGSVEATEVLLVGIGDGSSANLAKAAGKVGRTARTHEATHVALSFPKGDTNERIECFGVGNYAYEPYRSEDDATPKAELLTLWDAPINLDAANARVAAQTWARDLVNAPAADIYPESLADEAKKLAEIPGVTVTVWDKARLEQEDCVGILAVGQGSDRPPVMIRIQYRPENAKAHICLVGKGVTFDAGGLSLKPSSGMQTMRCDMGGSATALGITAAVASQKLPVALDVFVGAVENMVSGNSYKLGDILRYRNGVNVEIHNTDAEGRLVLADCLIEASKVDGATHILDFATLTGAAVVAVGSQFSALFTEDDELAGELLGKADDTGEGLWRLPLHAPYKELLKAEWGTIKNVGGREAGSVTAALFLQHFVSGKRWAHFDIAGPAFLDKASGMYAAGGTGQMVRSVSSWIASLAD